MAKRSCASALWARVSSRKAKKSRWLDVQAAIQPGDRPHFDGPIKVQLSQIVFGMLGQGMTVNIKFDPAEPSKAVLADDVNALLAYRKVDGPGA